MGVAVVQLLHPDSAVHLREHERMFLLAMGAGWADGDIKRWLVKADVQDDRLVILGVMYTLMWGKKKHTSKDRRRGKKRNSFAPTLQGCCWDVLRSK